MEIFSFFIYICLLMPIVIDDYREHRIPNKYIKILIICRIIIFVCESAMLLLKYGFKRGFEAALPVNFVADLLSGILIFVIFSIITILSKNNMGFGDVKLFMTLGLYFGFVTSIEIILLSMILIIIYSLILKIFGRKTDGFPVAPFVLISISIRAFL